MLFSSYNRKTIVSAETSQTLHRRVQDTRSFSSIEIQTTRLKKIKMNKHCRQIIIQKVYRSKVLHDSPTLPLHLQPFAPTGRFLFLVAISLLFKLLSTSFYNLQGELFTARIRKLVHLGNNLILHSLFYRQTLGKFGIVHPSRKGAGAGLRFEKTLTIGSEWLPLQDKPVLRNKNFNP